MRRVLAGFLPAACFMLLMPSCLAAADGPAPTPAAAGTSGPSLSLDYSLFAAASLSALNDADWLNPDNVLGFQPASGDLSQAVDLGLRYGLGLRMGLGATLHWFEWDSAMTAADLPSALAGAAGRASVDLREWLLAWTSPDGLLDLGVGRQPWHPEPAKILKSADYFGWIFGGQAKTMTWLGLVQDVWAVKLVAAPRAAWVPELFGGGEAQYPSSNPRILPGGDIWMVQGQLFPDSLDQGAYLAYDNSWTVGQWLSLPLNPDLVVYDEFSWTDKKWMPYLNPSDFSILYDRKNGIRATLGLQFSPSWLDLSMYTEGAYNGDGYAAGDWSTLNDHLAVMEDAAPYFPGLRLGTYGALAERLRYGSMSQWYFAVHLKPNGPIADLLDWSLSLRFEVPSGVYSRLGLELLLPGDLSLKADWDMPVPGQGAVGSGESWIYAYRHRLDLSLGVRARLNSP